MPRWNSVSAAILVFRFGPMLVRVLVQPMVRHELGRVWLAVVVAVIVDEDRGAVVAKQTATERLGEQRRHEHLLWRAVFDVAGSIAA